MKKPAVFFDRDGVLNHDAGYTHRIEDFNWIDGAVSAIKLFNDMGWFVFVVTNQAGVARGYYNQAAVSFLHGWMQQELRAHGAHVDSFYYCPHHPAGNVFEFARSCECRKPEPGLILKAFSEWPIDQNRAYLIGDKPSDIEAAQRAGIKGVLFEGGDLLDFVRGMDLPFSIRNTL